MFGVPVITVEQMRQWEKAAWDASVKESDVIANVGRAVGQRLMQLTRPGDAILLLAGRGHNGDDARAAVAHVRDRQIILIDVTEPKSTTQEIATALKTPPAWIVDGLFGIGLDRPLDDDWQALINAVNAAEIPVFAVDTPSGLNAATGKSEGAAIQATITLTIGAPKTGLIGSPFVGRLEVASDVGLVSCPCDGELRWTLPSDFTRLPPPRAVDTNKGTFGHVAILAGSVGYHGAAVLASHGALRAQPGLVTIIPQAAVYVPIAAQSQAAMVQPWQAGTHLPATSTAALFGPGMAAADIPQILKDDMARLWKTSPLAVVADATGLGWLKRGHVQEKSIRVITPHPGEAARLLDVPLREIVGDRVGSLREMSRRFGDCIVVLKGHHTLVGRATGPIFVNGSGNPWLAQGGSGDLLGGYLAGLLAQPSWQKDPLTTVRYAVWQHGAAADQLVASQANWTIEDLSRILGTVRPA
jgi:hydroxyethylthiazole kinase-like uncharacterized protein yjeF